MSSIFHCYPVEFLRSGNQQMSRPYTRRNRKNRRKIIQSHSSPLLAKSWNAACITDFISTSCISFVHINMAFLETGQALQSFSRHFIVLDKNLIRTHKLIFYTLTLLKLSTLWITLFFSENAKPME
jgi:hypothetical protein